VGAALIWFRRDLRMNDNPALAAAAEADEVVPVFVFERGLLAGRHASPNRNAYLFDSLRELDENLRAAGSRLHLREGDPAREIPALAAEAGADVVHVNRDHTVHARARDRRVEAALAKDGVELTGHAGLTCAEITRIETGSGDPFRVFTPFSRAWMRADRRELAVRPRRLRSPSGLTAGRLPAESSAGIDAGAKRIAAAMGPGEVAGRRRMHRAAERAGEYAEIRDLPGLDRTTRLSPPLHFGTVSPREVETLLAGQRSEGAKALRRQLAWRDFWLSVIRAFPGNRTREYD
jgi:deoxyribodipyrimidine photo-lyase